MKNKFLLAFLLFSMAVITKTDAQPTVSPLYGKDGNKYTSKDTMNANGWNKKVFKFTDLVKQSLTFQLTGAKVGAGNMGGYWYIQGTTNGVNWYHIAKIDLVNADSTYGYTIPYINPCLYYQTVVRDTGSGNKSYITQFFYR